MPHEKINGIQIYYECNGDDTEKGAIVLLHHGFGCTKIWKDIYRALLKKGYRVLMYDRRGYGQSEKGPDFIDFYVSDRFRPESVEELARLIDFVGMGRVHLIGQCEGGVVAADFATRYPDQVKSMVISSTQCFSRTRMVEKNALMFPKPFRELDPELKDKLVEWHGEAAESFFDQFRRFGGAYGTDVFDLRPVLSSVQCPTLVLYPDRSSLFEVEQGVAMYRSLPKGELAVLPACGHNTYQYRPDDYVQISLRFIERHQGVNQGLPNEMTSCLAVRSPAS